MQPNLFHNWSELSGMYNKTVNSETKLSFSHFLTHSSKYAHTHTRTHPRAHTDTHTLACHTTVMDVVSHAHTWENMSVSCCWGSQHVVVFKALSLGADSDTLVVCRACVYPCACLCGSFYLSPLFLDPLPGSLWTVSVSVHSWVKEKADLPGGALFYNKHYPRTQFLKALAPSENRCQNPDARNLCAHVDLDKKCWRSLFD